MPHSTRPDANAPASLRASLVSFAFIGAATIAARLPFLLRADRFFDADEAVEGLMARHVLTGEHPLFLWGQRYKGVPEVYLTAAVFRAAPPTVVALKAVTLACFVVFLCLNFRLLQRVCSQAVAWIATAFLIAGPPSLVFWSMSGSAEIVMTLIAGTVLLLAIEATLKRSPNRASPYSIYIAAAALGFGLWIQQFILYYVVSLAVTAAIVTPGWRATLQQCIRARVPAWLRAVLVALAAVAALYLLLGLMAFFGGGFQAGGITATHPQKMWWIAGVLVATAVAIVTICVFRGQLAGPALAFLVGYAPALIGRIGNRGMGAPISRLDAAALGAALPDITHVMFPILFGWRDPMARPTLYPRLALLLAIVAAVSYWLAWRRTVTPFFHVFPLVAATMFFVSGSYIDAQSYRYLMPIYAALPVVYAIGVVGLWRANRLAGAVVFVSAVTIFVTQQVVWYTQLAPDRESQRVLECLDSADIRTARAGYWQSYKLTFLSGERIIVSPLDGMDRYPKYSEQTREAPSISRRCP